MSYYFTDSTNARIRVVDAGTINTLTLDPAFISGGGFAVPWGMQADGSGHLFVVDEGLKQIYRVTIATGAVDLIAGGGSGDAPCLATDRAFGDPYEIAVDDSGNVYVTDLIGGHVVLAINMQGTTQTILGVSIPAGYIAIVAGVAALHGFTGDGGAATSAKLHAPYGLKLNSAGDLFICDSLNNRIRKVDHSTGIITTVAGIGPSGIPGSFGGDGGDPLSANLDEPIMLDLDASGNIYINDGFNFRVRVINTQGTTQTICGVSVAANTIETIAGDGTPGYAGDGGAAISAGIGTDASNGPWSARVDSTGDLYICDSENYRIRKVDHSSGIISTVAGDGTNGSTGDGGAATSAKIGQVFDIAFPGSGAAEEPQIFITT